MNPFPRHPVDGHHEDVGFFSGLRHFFLRRLRSRIKLQGKLPADIQRPAAVLHRLNAAQTDDAPDRQRPISRIVSAQSPSFLYPSSIAVKQT